MAHCTYGYAKHMGIAHFHGTIIKLSNSPSSGFHPVGEGGKLPQTLKLLPQTRADQCKILAAT